MSAKPPKLLLVEDDLGLQTQIRWSLPGYEVLTATDREDVLNQLRRFEPPVVILDLGLPPNPDGATEGLVTRQRILAVATSTKVVVITGNQDQAKPSAARPCPKLSRNQRCSGMKRGAFTGAAEQTLGKFEYARNGTLFLDEIGDMPMALQAKLLRFLQDRHIERLCARGEIRVNVRVVAATRQNLEARIKSGLFREDLLYRLSEVTVRIPPLRDRRSHGA